MEHLQRALIERAQGLRSALSSSQLRPRTGRVTRCVGALLESDGPDAFVGECCLINVTDIAAIRAEVVGFRDGKVLLLPYAHLGGIRPGSEVSAIGRQSAVRVGQWQLGQTLNAFGQPFDGSSIPGSEIQEKPLYADPIIATRRSRIDQFFETGIAVIDGLLSLGIGQRIGLFAGSGVGKSTLLGAIARNSEADINVIALIGERGREVREFIEDSLGDGLSRSVVIVATADQPALLRVHAAYAATTIAEYFRDRGQHVALFVDSLTRFAMAQREVGLVVGEPPTARGYTPSVFSALPRLLERAGPGLEGSGSITGIYTVLLEGLELDDPIGDHARASLDGHIVLSHELAVGHQYPAIDVLESVSRLQSKLVSAEQMQWVEKARSLLSVHQKNKDLVSMGAYVEGTDKVLDEALTKVPKLHTWAKQSAAETRPRAKAMQDLREILQA